MIYPNIVQDLEKDLQQIDQQMLLPYLPVLNQKKIILGSQSKSRNELFTTQKIKYERIPSKFVQDLDKQSFASPSDYNMETCKGKADDLLKTFKQEKKEWDILVCGDTIVSDAGKIIQKPQNQAHCIQMMNSLANKTHKIYTAHIIVFNTQPQIRYEWVTEAQVSFGDVPLISFQEFSKTDEPYIHSGGYQLTAISGSFIRQVKGSHTAIQGLDMYQICHKIIEGAKTAKWIE